MHVTTYNKSAYNLKGKTEGVSGLPIETAVWNERAQGTSPQTWSSTFLTHFLVSKSQNIQFNNEHFKV